MDYVSKLFNLPKGVIPFSMIPVGRPLQEKAAEDRFDPRRIFFETYG